MEDRQVSKLTAGGRSIISPSYTKSSRHKEGYSFGALDINGRG
jgi:hypothetical protein